jgi:hypothetical protein
LPSSSAARDPSRVSGANAAIHGAAKRRRPFRRGRHSRRRRPLLPARFARNGRLSPGRARSLRSRGTARSLWSRGRRATLRLRALSVALWVQWTSASERSARANTVNPAIHEARRAEAVPARAAIPAKGGHW